MPRNRIQKFSDAQEKGSAEAYGGKVQPGSGSGWIHRQDVKSDRYLIEDKRTGAKQITISKKDWEQLRKEALLLDRVPVMDIELGGRNYTMMLREDVLDLMDES